ncbi:hypothetical protein [Polaromonas sp.]|uniref:hypothetical protein n=1 Tax=Polaromonas sp. TaxID=1869339 RepID=UPI0032677150
MGWVLLIWLAAIFAFLLVSWNPPITPSQQPADEIDACIPAAAPTAIATAAVRKGARNLRILGASILLLNLWLIGRYNLTGITVLLLTFGFAIAFEFFVARPAAKRDRSGK